MSGAFMAAATPRVMSAYSSSMLSSGLVPAFFSPITVGVQSTAFPPMPRILSTSVRSPFSNSPFGVPRPFWLCQTSLIPM